jgi:hypothetical protein
MPDNELRRRTPAELLNPPTDQRRSPQSETRRRPSNDSNHRDGGPNIRRRLSAESVVLSPNTRSDDYDHPPSHFRSQLLEEGDDNHLVHEIPNDHGHLHQGASRSSHAVGGADEADGDDILQFPSLVSLVRPPDDTSFSTASDIDSLYVCTQYINCLLDTVNPESSFRYSSLLLRTSSTSTSRFRAALTSMDVRRSTVRGYKVYNAPLSWFPNIQLGSITTEGQTLVLNMYYLGVTNFSKTNYFTNPMLSVVMLAFNIARNFRYSCDFLGLDYDLFCTQNNVVIDELVDDSILRRCDALETASGGKRNEKSNVKPHQCQMNMGLCRNLFQYFIASLKIIAGACNLDEEHHSFFLNRNRAGFPDVKENASLPYSLEGMSSFAADLLRCSCFTMQSAGMKHTTRCSGENFTFEHPEEQEITLTTCSFEEMQDRVLSNCNENISTFVNRHFILEKLHESRDKVFVFVDVGIEISPVDPDDVSFVIDLDQGSSALSQALR